MVHTQVAQVVEQTQQAWLGWRATSFAERAPLMKAAAQVLRDNGRSLCTDDGPGDGQADR